MQGIRYGVAALVSSCLLVACGGSPAPPSSGANMNGLEGTSLRELDFPASGRAGSARDSARVFISGHSLVDQPFPANLALIAQGAGKQLEWNRQYIVGSSILARTRGVDAPEGSWQGYRTGYNRDSENMDVLAELRAPRTVSGPYDVLLITEQHTLLGAMLWQDMVRLLRHYHDHFIAANPAGSTYLYESWLSLDNKDDPSRWIAYERSARPVWQCVATRINVALAREGRADRIVPVPAALALAELVARATSNEGLPGVTRGSVRATVDLLINDDVHVTEAGSYFVSLVSYATIFRQPPGGAAPPSVDPDTARVLQEFAWEFVSTFFRDFDPPDVGTCAQTGRDFHALYQRYMYDILHRPNLGPLRARVRSIRHRLEWGRVLSAGDARNPFHFDPATDASYWITPQ